MSTSVPDRMPLSNKIAGCVPTASRMAISASSEAIAFVNLPAAMVRHDHGINAELDRPVSVIGMKNPFQHDRQRRSLPQRRNVSQDSSGFE